MSDPPENSPKNPAQSGVSSGNQSVSAMPALTDSREKFVEQAMVEYESPLIGYAATILHDIDRARDVVQDTFIRLCQQDVGKVEQASLKTWLFTVCRNRAFDILRKDKRVQPLDEVRWRKVAGPDLSPDQQVVHDERVAEVMKYLSRLSENQREVILLKFQQGLSYQEIQKITGLTQGNIGFLIHTGLKRVREMLPDDLR
jgi:RNA polymerase sigma-70 factor (ECF subfamily)